MNFKLEYFDETLDCWIFVRAFISKKSALHHLKLYKENYPDYIFRIIQCIAIEL